MVFSSIPTYLDPSNWHQQHHHHHQQSQGGGFHHGINNNNNNITINPSLTNPNPLVPPPQHPQAQPPLQSGPIPLPAPGGSIRPGSMAERARMANIPMPEMSLKCPRCDSTNTKFCYFNNYSLSQPRHFCKTCRRYWTRGGALRNVPVGGGCRRNKRSSKSTSSSKSATSDRSSSAAAATSSASSGMSAPTPHASMEEMMGLMSSMPPGLSNLRFMSPPLDFGDQLGLSNYELGSMASGGAEQWRIPPPFLLDGSSGTSLYGNAFEGGEFSGLAIGGSGGPLRLKAAEGVKDEETRGGAMSLMRRFNMGINNINSDGNHGLHVEEETYNNWGGGSSSSGNAWATDLSAINNNNSSCSNASVL